MKPLFRSLWRGVQRLAWGCWRCHADGAWEHDCQRLRCTRCWLVVWDAEEHRAKLAKVGITLVLLLCASAASADTISATVKGCGPLPVGATFVGSNPHAGFVFMAYHDPMSGCAETTTGATSGTHVAFINAAGLYQVDVLAALLPDCGRIQYDAQAYALTGLDPLQLHTYVYDTGRDCLETDPSARRDGAGATFSAPPAVGIIQFALWPDGPVVPPFTPQTPPLCLDCGIDPHTVTPVPEPASLLLVGSGLLLCFRRKR